MPLTISLADERRERRGNMVTVSMTVTVLRGGETLLTDTISQSINAGDPNARDVLLRALKRQAAALRRAAQLGLRDQARFGDLRGDLQKALTPTPREAARG